MSRHLVVVCAMTVYGMTLPLTAGTATPGRGRGERTGRVPRTVLALYDGTRVADSRDTAVHALAEMPLNHLGLVVRYHDLHGGLPPVESLRDVRGVLTWFDSDATPHAAAYLAWLARLGETGIPLVSLGALGGTRDGEGRPLPLESVNRAYGHFGWQVDGRWHTTTSGAIFPVQDRRLVGFERPLPRLVPGFASVRADPALQARVALRVAVPGRPTAASDVVIVGPRGAYVAPGFAYFSDRSGDREFRQWYVNPFELFRESFRADEVPKPDTATLSGRRIYYSHVDGDGWRNLTQIEPHRSRYVTAARVVLDEIVRPFPDLPVTIGAIVGDLDPSWAGTEESRAVARALYALPHVEAAIHTYSHPLEWAAFDEGQSPRLATDDAPRVRGPDLLQQIDGKTRVYDTRPFSLHTEFDEASRYLEGLLPPGKQTALVQWSGDTRPFERALAHVRQTGLPNINGGDTRFDREFPSTAWVSPLGTWVGRELQVYASNSNENTYTDLWRDRFFGFAYLTRTVRNTGVPRRLKPFNVYYHMYSGERLSSLNAVLANLAYARSLPLAPVQASRFSRIVEGFYSTAIDAEGPRRWRVRNRGALQTLRLDHATLDGVDFAASSGVVGQRHELGSLFIALDERDEAPLVVLKRTAPSAAEPREPAPYLVDGRWRVHSLQRSAEATRFVAEGYGPGEMTWSWPRDARVEARWRARSGAEGTVRATTDAAGLVTIRLPMMSGEPVDVVLTASPGASRGSH